MKSGKVSTGVTIEFTSKEIRKGISIYYRATTDLYAVNILHGSVSLDCSHKQLINSSLTIKETNTLFSLKINIIKHLFLYKNLLFFT